MRLLLVFFLAVLVLLLCGVATCTLHENNNDALGDAEATALPDHLVDAINADPRSTWRAERNRFSHTKVSLSLFPLCLL